MEKITKIIILIIILIIIVNVMPKNENFDIPLIKTRIAPEQSKPVYLYNEYYNVYLHIMPNNQLHLMNIRPGETQFNIDGRYIKFYEDYINKDSNLISNIVSLPIKFVTNTNNGAFKFNEDPDNVYANYIQWVGGGNFYGENSTLTINDDKSFNINYISPNKLDSKNKFVIIK